MIDDLKYIHERDAQDALGIAERQSAQYSYDFALSFIQKEAIQDVVFAGMGGSALAAAVFKSWPGVSVPFEVVRGYDLPAYVSEKTLVIVSSYSGNTEETLSAMRQAKERSAQMALISSGGLVAEFAEEHNLTHIVLPAGMQPRMTLGYQLTALVQLLEPLGLILEGSRTELERAADWLAPQLENWIPIVATENNLAKKIALEMIGKSPVIYAGPLFAAVAYKWKISFNENAKNVAWCGVLPEFNHNEFLGWTSHPVDKPYAVVDLRSNLEHPRVQKRFEITEKLLSGRRPSPVIVEPHGETALQQILWTIALGDFVSLYTALLNGLNPTPVALIEKLKEALNN